jgi:hypothetical protein
VDAATSIKRAQAARFALALVVMLSPGPILDAQRGQGPAAPPQTPRAAAAIDITGTCTAVITEDWPLRMLPLRKGDYTRMPLTPAARKVADTWDPARDEAAGEQCKGYTAASITRMPGRIRLAWQDETTMKMELEAGSQTRLFHFRPVPSPGEPSWLGYSSAEWLYTRQPPRSGELRVVTNRLRPGYLRKNGVPLSANATVTEYYHRFTAPNKDIWLTVVTEVRDPENLQVPYVQSTHFKKLPDGAPFRPEPCSAR